MSDFFNLYNKIFDSIDTEAYVENLYAGPRWSIAKCEGNLGLAMSTEGSTIAPMFHKRADIMQLSEFSKGIMSWNFPEASLAMAACNAFFNRAERMAEFKCYEPYENYCTRGLKLSGAVIGLVGHLTITDEMQSKAEKIYILEKSPQDGDYPDSACDYILPKCDIVIITGSSIINKTLPHLLQLCENATSTILTGPTVPMCPALLDCGIDRLAGMIVTKQEEMEVHATSGAFGSPYPYGTTFLLEK